MSVKGEFYEQELNKVQPALHAERRADTMVVESFFNRKVVHGRLFALTGRKPKDSH
jgi:hypothetical protein